MQGKYIHVGIGMSSHKDEAEAARSAITQSLESCGGSSCKGTSRLSIVYTDSSCNQKAILKEVNALLGTAWIGISTDKIFASSEHYDPDVRVGVLTLASDYLHFGISVANNYRKQPARSAKKAVAEAITNCKADKHLDAYVQFTRAKNKDYASIIRNPPYFVLTFISGITFRSKQPVPGHESEFISGLLEYTGPHIPVFGGSASSSLEDYMQSKGKNYQFANGKLYTDAAIVVFAISDLKFATTVEHGYLSTNDFAAVTKLDAKGYTIKELNGREPVAEYARLLGISKTEYLKDPSAHSFNRPFGLVQGDGTTFIKEAMPSKNKKYLESNFHLHKNSILNVLKFNRKETLGTLPRIIKHSTRKPQHIAVALFCSCSGRRPLIKNIESKEVDLLKKNYPQLPFFGFYSFGEVGSTKSSSANSHSQTITALIIFDQLLTE